MAIARLIKLLTTATDAVHADTKVIDNIMKAGTKEDVDYINNLINTRFDVKVEGGNTYYTPKTNIRKDAMATSIQKEAVAGKTGINLGNVPDPQSKIGADLNTSSYVSTVIMPEHLRRELPKTNNTRKVLSTFVTDDFFQALPAELSFEGKKLGPIRKTLTGAPKEASGELANELVEMPTNLKQYEDRLNQVYGDLADGVTKGLNKAEYDEWNHIVSEYDEASIPEKIVNEGFDINGRVYPANRKVQDAVLAHRELQNHSYIMQNNIAVRTAKKDGGLLLDGTDIIKPAKQTEVKVGSDVNGRVWGKDLKDQGYTLWRKNRKDGITYEILSPAERTSRTSQIPDDFKILHYKQGYAPRRYTQPWAITKLSIGTEGAMKGKVIASRIATARSRRAAETAVEKVSGQDDGIGYFAHRSYEDGLDLAIDNDLPHIIDNFTPTEMADLQKALTGLQFSDKDITRLLKFKNFFSHKRNTTMMRRGRRLIDADTIDADKPEFAAVLPHDQALAAHMQKTAKYAAHSEYFKMLEDAYMNEFSGFLKKGEAWHEAIDLSQSPINGRSVREAFGVQAQLKRIDGRISYFDGILDQYVRNVADTLSTSPGGKQLYKVVDDISAHFGFDLDWPSPSQLVGTAKSFGAVAKLGLWNMSQLPMQATAMLNVLGYHGPDAIKAGGDLISVFMAPRLGLKRTKGADELYNLIQDSGFVSGFDFVTIADAAKGNNKLANSRMLKRLYDTNLIAYQMGEGSVRATAWFAEHRKMLAKIKKGTAPFKMEDVGSRVYLNAISEGARVPALNMSRMNQPLMARGIIGMPLQFQQFVLQQYNFMFGKMSHLQRAGVFGAWIGAFGAEGIPFFMDALSLSENIVAQKEGPEAYGWWQRMVSGLAGYAGEKLDKSGFRKWMDKAGVDSTGKQFLLDYFYGGALPAITDGQVSFAHRAGMARYFSDMFYNTSLEDLAGPALLTANTIVGNTFENLGEVFQMVQGDDKFTTNWALNKLSKQVEGLAGPSNAIEAIEAYHRGELRDKNLNLLDDEPTFGQLVTMGLGLGYQEQQKRYERIFKSKRRSDVINQIIYEKAEDIAETAVDMPELGQAKFLQTAAQIMDYNPTLLQRFYSRVTNAKIGRELPAADREAWKYMSRYSKELSTQEVEDLFEEIQRRK